MCTDEKKVYLPTTPYKGTRDFFPAVMAQHQWVFGTMKKSLQTFGYAEYNGPMLESLDVYAAKSGEEIVQRQLYSFKDRGDRAVAIRPEMTPTLARMVASQFHEIPKPIRWFSIPNLWRYEQPQRGRLREHWQLNVDLLGGDALLADIEILHIASSMVSAFGGDDYIKIYINHRDILNHVFSSLNIALTQGHTIVKAMDARAKIGEKEYFKTLDSLELGHRSQLVEDFFQDSLATTLSKYPSPGAHHLQSILHLMQEHPSSLKHQVYYNPTIMRGFDYYTGLVFEIYDTSAENPRALFGGGRYDNLIGLFGKHQLTGVGFGMGDVTFVHFLETHNLLNTTLSYPLVYIGFQDIKDMPVVFNIAHTLRSHQYSCITALSHETFKESIKAALKHGTKFLILLGAQELAEGNILIKDLQTQTQTTLALTALIPFLQTTIPL